MRGGCAPSPFRLSPLGSTVAMAHRGRIGHYAFVSTNVPDAPTPLPDAPTPLPFPTPLAVLEKSSRYYEKQAWYAKTRYHWSEILLLLVAAAIPASTAFTSDQRVPAALGALVVVLAGLRSVYRWHEDWLRFTEALVQLETAKQLYIHCASPYDGEDRDALLVRRVREIESAETHGWVQLRNSAARDAPADKE